MSTRKVTLRVPQAQFEKIKQEAKEKGIPYQTLMNQILSGSTHKRDIW